MSPISGWNTLRSVAFALLLCGAGIVHARPVAPLPFEPVSVGAGTMRFMGFTLYDGTLWSSSGRWDREAPYALELIYARSFRGDAIARRSIDEIRRLQSLDDDTAQRWEAQLQRIFPDVKAGDRLTGVRLPGQGVRFYAGGRALGRVDDERLADAFFAIWLDPRTRAPELRRKLLGTQ